MSAKGTKFTGVSYGHHRSYFFEKGLPANVDAERFVLGSILLNQDTYFQSRGRDRARGPQPQKAPPHFRAHEGPVRSRRKNRSRHAGQ